MRNRAAVIILAILLCAAGTGPASASFESQLPAHRLYLPMLYGLDELPVPPAPPALTASLAGNWVRLAWPDPSGLESGYLVEAAAPGSSFRQMAQLAADSYTHEMLLDIPGEWRFRVRAFNASGYSGYSPKVSVQLAVPLVQVRVVNTSSLFLNRLDVDSHSVLSAGENIPSDGEMILDLLPGPHTLHLALGATGAEYYSWSVDIQPAGPSLVIDVADPTITQILTIFSTSAAWYQNKECYRFFADATFHRYIGDDLVEEGTYGGGSPFGPNINFDVTGDSTRTGRYYPDIKRFDLPVLGGFQYRLAPQGYCPQ